MIRSDRLVHKLAIISISARTQQRISSVVRYLERNACNFDFIIPELYIVRITLRFVSLSDIMTVTQLLLAMKQSIATMHELVVRLLISSIWITLVVMHVKIIYPFFSTFLSSHTFMGPKQSVPVLVNGRANADNMALSSSLRYLWCSWFCMCILTGLTWIANKSMWLS